MWHNNGNSPAALTTTARIRRRVLRLALLLAAGLAAGAGMTAAQDLNLPLRVVETAGVDRVDEVVTSGIPIPRELDILTPDRLGLVDAGNRPIPVQFKVLSRWHGQPADTTKPIKWLLVTFLSSAHAITEETVHLRWGARPTLAQPVKVTDSSSAVLVDTGPMQFTVSKTSFNLFDRLYVNGRQIVRPDSLNGFNVRDYTGKVFRSAARAPDTVVVEEAGPLRAVIRVEGVHGNGQDQCLRYIVRIHAYAGKSHVRVFYALRNDASYGYTNTAGHRYVMDAVLDLRCQLGSLLTATFRDEAYTLAPGESRLLEQDMAGADSSSKVKDTNLNLHDNFIRRIRDETGKILVSVGGVDGGTEAGRDPGFMDLGNSTAGVTVGLRHFWQNFPKSLAASHDGHLRIGLLPAFGSYVDPGYYKRTPPPPGAEDDYTFGGGRQKTHELFLAFRTAPLARARGRALVTAFNTPLVATAPPRWYARSGAIQLMVVNRQWLQQPGLRGDLRRDFHRFERFQAAKFTPSAVDPVRSVGLVTYKSFRRRGGPYGGRQFYGWMNFGDTPWGAGYAQGHYDWPFSTLLSAVRMDERELLELGLVMARHRMDIDQYHTTQDRYNVSGGQRFEKGEHHGDMTVPPTPSHTWVHGLLLYWALTGDAYAREAAEEVLNFYRGYWTRVGPPFYGMGTEVRIGGWSLMGLTEIYDYLGKSEALVLARRIVASYINHEQAENLSGYYMGNDSFIMPWQQGIYLNGLGKYYFHTGAQDEAARRLMDRIASWFVSQPNGFGPLLGGTGPATSYTPYTLWYKWHPDPAKRSGSPRVNMAHMIDGLAYAYMGTGKDAYLDTALRCASDIWRYWTLSSSTVDRTDPGQWEPISMRPTKFPNSETKVLGWLTRYGFVLSYAAYMRELMPPILVNVEPKGTVAGPFSLRFRVLRNRPIFRADGRRSYDGYVIANGINQTAIVHAFFDRVRTPFTETWFAPAILKPGQGVTLDVAAWDAPWVHQMVTRLEGTQ